MILIFVLTLDWILVLKLVLSQLILLLLKSCHGLTSFLQLGLLPSPSLLCGVMSVGGVCACAIRGHAGWGLWGGGCQETSSASGQVDGSGQECPCSAHAHTMNWLQRPDLIFNSAGWAGLQRGARGAFRVDPSSRAEQPQWD